MSWFGLGTQKYGHLSPLYPYISETAFSHRFQKVYTYPPPYATKFWCIGRKIEKTEKVRICSVLAPNGCPREICYLASSLCMDACNLIMEGASLYGGRGLGDGMGLCFGGLIFFFCLFHCQPPPPPTGTITLQVLCRWFGLGLQ